MEKILITTLIPTYQRPQLLKRAIESVLDQTATCCQAYVFDNASGDHTEEIVRDFQRTSSRVLYHRHEKNVGLAKNFIFALRQVETPYFSFLSDDDYLLPWFYETALQGFDKHSEIGFSACRTVVLNGKGKILPQEFFSNFPKGYFPPRSLRECIGLNWTGILFRKETAIFEEGLDDTGTPFDVDFTLRHGVKYPFFVDEKPSTIYVTWKNSHSYNQFTSSSEYTFLKLSPILKKISKEVKNASEVRELSTFFQRKKMLTHRMFLLVAILMGEKNRLKIFHEYLITDEDPNLAKFVSYLILIFNSIPFSFHLCKLSLNSLNQTKKLFCKILNIFRLKNSEMKLFYNYYRKNLFEKFNSTD